MLKFLNTLFKKKEGDRIDNDYYNAIFYLHPSEVYKLDFIPSVGICGEFKGKSLAAVDFIENPEFVNFMHHVIAERGPKLDSMKEAAMFQKEGYLYVVDFRTPEGIMGNVPPEDIIGAFKVEEGKVVKDSYWRNDNHKIFTINGRVVLPPGLHEILVEEIIRKD